LARPKRLRVIVEADGGARGNPGPAGFGAVVREAATGEVLVELGESLGTTTNNVAEYNGMIAGLRAAADLGAVEVEVRMDSKLVVEQMSGRWQIKHPGLRPLAAQAATLVTRFESVRFTWVPREQNAAADALANAAMDGIERKAPLLAPPEPTEETAAAPARTPAPSWAPRSPGGATRLILVRHGETEYTAQRRYSGRGDVALSVAGLAQAQAVAGRVAVLAGPDAVVVSSPLARCRRTAEAIAERLAAAHGLADVPVQVEESLVECDFGEWEGLTFAEVRERWPDQMQAWLASPEVAPPGGESFAAVSARVGPAVDRLVQANPDRAVVLVSHVSPIKLVLRDALAAADAFLHRLFLDAAGISVLDRWPDGGIAVRTVNDTAHLS
jgi:broad specificity phosphatase PhoE/ribonuclease HI